MRYDIYIYIYVIRGLKVNVNSKSSGCDTDVNIGNSRLLRNDRLFSAFSAIWRTYPEA